MNQRKKKLGIRRLWRWDGMEEEEEECLQTERALKQMTAKKVNKGFQINRCKGAQEIHKKKKKKF